MFLVQVLFPFKERKDRNTEKSFGTFPSHLDATDHTCILPMAAVVTSPSKMTTAQKRGLSSSTVDVVHPDWARTTAKCCPVGNGSCTGEAQLPTHHVRLSHIPPVITHRSPLSVDVHFNTAIVKTSIRQTNDRRSIRAPHTGIAAVSAVMVAPSSVSAIVHMGLTP